MASLACPLASRVPLWSAFAVALGSALEPRGTLQESVELARLSEPLQRSLVLMPAGNVGNAPFFGAPVSWLMTWRSRRLHAFVNEAASRHGAVVVNLFRERADDPFVLQPWLNASDGLHPDDAGYRVWFGELMAQAALPQRLCAALVMDR